MIILPSRLRFDHPTIPATDAQSDVATRACAVGGRDTPGPTWHLLTAMMRHQRRELEEKALPAPAQQRVTFGGTYKDFLFNHSVAFTKLLRYSQYVASLQNSLTGVLPVRVAAVLLVVVSIIVGVIVTGPA